MDLLVTRHPANPIIRPEHIPGGANCVFNSGATLHDGEIVMLLSTWVTDWTPKFLVARSKDGIHFDVSPRNVVTPPKEYRYVPHEGIFDTRITTMEGWLIIYYGAADTCIALATARVSQLVDACLRDGPLTR